MNSAVLDVSPGLMTMRSLPVLNAFAYAVCGSTATPAGCLMAGKPVPVHTWNEVTVSSMEMLEAFKRPARQIVDEVLDVLEHSSPELVADIAQNGIVLTGGGSLLYGFDKLISERTEIACSIADDADSCVANGCGRSLQWISSMQEGTINLARRKLMKEQ